MKTQLQALLFMALFSNIVPLIIAILYLIQGGDSWGGQLPQLIMFSFIFMILAGLFCIIILTRVSYTLGFNKNYDGSQSSIRALLFGALLYLIVTLMGGITIHQFTSSSNQSTCKVSRLYNLWGKEVYDEGLQAYNNFCHSCQCKISQSDLQYYPKSVLYSMNYSTVTGAEDISLCRPEEGKLETSTFEKLKQMERTYSCAGFCNNNPAFTFAGTSKGIPTNQNGCFKQVQQEFDKMRAAFLSVNIILLFFMIFSFFASIRLRKIKIKEILSENGLLFYESVNSVSIIGASNNDFDWRAHDVISISDQQRSNDSNNKNNMQYMRTNYQHAATPSETTSNFNQSQFLEKQETKKEQIDKMKSVRKAFRSMHNPTKSLLKK
ncbi:transmembrane protein, putative (macronuclear) [Tetrahymena thermophila SB210]|uniref:Transmembrane protein, putative n=1 Tax=Tetrahymena thermophila (strain SB210) TaxID=312017 RepID=Q23G38_TETTS|nr:transmembrane protein, putative [Tetrahymena thermophila SB210]EAR95422.1 transmembrane protein, putative [Tetrahymena thermophila SB210]|eukprot:XP_001015667.1 transmembrane protein, putative [Tetrahymena thermophila SB210]